MKIEFIDCSRENNLVATAQYPETPIPHRGDEIIIHDKDGNEVWGTVLKVKYRLIEYSDVPMEKTISVYFVYDS